MSAHYEYIDHARGARIALYYEDDHIALNTVEPRGRIENPDRYSYHEIMLNPGSVEHLIKALTEMQSTIRTRYQKAIES